MTFMREKRLVTGILCSALFMSIVPLNTGETVCADTFISFDDNTVTHNEFRSVENYEYNAEVNTLAQWDGHSNIEITFTNTGDEIIHNWYFTFDYNYNIENPYNCFILEHENTLYTIGNNDWNQDILPGESVTIGFTAASDDGSEISDEPTFYLLNTKTIARSSSELAWSFEQYSDWTTGFSGALILVNNSEEQIRDWTITFNSNRSITQVNAATLSTDTDGMYTISNDGNNQNIAAGQSYRIELQGGEHDPSESFALTNYSVSAKALAYTLDEDNDDNGIADVREIDFTGIVTVTPTATPIPTATSTPIVTNTPSPTAIPTTAPTINPTSTVTPTPSPIITVTPSVSATPTPTAIPTGISDDIDYEKDSDSDGLPDDFEDYYGTDKNKADSDSDGVNDYYELILSTDPLTPDSMGDYDNDGDGLTNARESELGTNPLCHDTDIDGLSDGEEVNLYGTDPTEYDTDSDGMNDYSEVHLGSDPNLPDSDVRRYQSLEFKPSGDTSLTGVTKVTVTGYISGAINENTQIKDIYGKDLQTSSIEALVGDPVSIETTGEFSSMTITFNYSEDINENYLKIMWFDEANGDYVVLNGSSINKARNTISITTNHFSKYMLIDEEVWVNTWAESMASTKDTSALARSYNLSGYEYDMSRLLDDDSDGLPNVFETNGMITSTGNIIYTDPNNPDTDNDGLLDGYEMGDLCLSETIFDRSPFWNYISAWYAGYGYRYDEYVYFKINSNPTLFSSDSDEIGDGFDATIFDENEAINYILYDSTDIYRIRHAKAYEAYFKNRKMNYEILTLYNKANFKTFFEKLEYGFEGIDETYKDYICCSKVQFSRVDNIIICVHGLTGYINGIEQTIHASDIAELLSNCSTIKIKNIDLLCCYSGDYDGETKSMAIELLRATHAEAVYGATKSISYLVVNFVLDGGGYYKYYYNSQNELVRKGGLFIFEVMLRIDDEDHVPFNVIDDYPF